MIIRKNLLLDIYCLSIDTAHVENGIFENTEVIVSKQKLRWFFFFKMDKNVILTSDNLIAYLLDK